MLKRFKVFTLAVAVIILSVAGSVLAEQDTDAENGTVNGTPDKYVEIVMDNSAINYGTMNVSGQADKWTAPDGTKYAIFDSLNLSSNQSIIFNEGASNSNIFAKLTYTGEIFPSTGGLDNTDWFFVKDTAATGYVQTEVTGTLTNGGGGVTLPAGVTEIGSYVYDDFAYFTTSDAGATWDYATKDIYVALGDNSRLYVGDTADLSSASYYEAKGGVVSAPFVGNSFTLATTFPTLAGETATLDFGYYMAWDNVQGNEQATFSSLINLPMHAAYNHNWTWNLTITGEFFSAVS